MSHTVVFRAVCILSEPDCGVKKHWQKERSVLYTESYKELYEELKQKEVLIFMKYELSPSILSADFARLGEEIKAVEQTGVNYLHIDVMDGMFVPSISFGFPIIKSIRKMSNMVFDVHPDGRTAGALYRRDSGKRGGYHHDPCRGLQTSGPCDRADPSAGKKAGIALNPSTSLHELDYLLEKVDMVLLMTVKSWIWKPEIHSVLHRKGERAAYHDRRAGTSDRY